MMSDKKETWFSIVLSSHNKLSIGMWKKSWLEFFERVYKYLSNTFVPIFHKNQYFSIYLNQKDIK